MNHAGRVLSRGKSKRCASWITGVTLAVVVGMAAPSHAITGAVRVTVAKAGFIVGAGGGKGVLTFRHRNYPFTVQGLSLGLTAGASINKLVGRADNINELSDFAGTYSAVGAGGALAGGVGGVKLRNDKGVTITLQGAKAGLEVSANITKVVIVLYQSRSTPD
jgi:lipid-binding SYLF domain-containing protein